MFSTDNIYEVITFSIGDTKAGTKMGKLQLKDTAGGEVLNCILWEEALNRMDSKLFRCGNHLRIVSGSYNEKYNNCLVTALELIKEAKTGLDEKEREEVYAELIEYIAKIGDDKLRQFVSNIYQENKEKILITPGAKMMHHNYIGGLMVHILECLKYAEVNMWQSTDTSAQKKMADYTYKLYFQMGNAKASRVFIYDNVETAEDFDTVLGENAIPSESKWYGTLKDVVVSGSETNLNSVSSSGTAWLKATVFYSEGKLDAELYRKANEYEGDYQSVTLGSGVEGGVDARSAPETQGADGEITWTEASVYSAAHNGDLSNVKSFCVMVEGQMNDQPYYIAKAEEVYFTVEMTGPEKTNEVSSDAIVNTDTYNKFTVRYARLDDDGTRSEKVIKEYPNYPINSDHTTVTLRDTILKLSIMKTDLERKNKWSTDTEYMLISGATFKIYRADEYGNKATTTDGNGNTVIAAPVENKTAGTD